MIVIYLNTLLASQTIDNKTESKYRPLSSYQHLLEEIDLRRRVNILFPNRQNIENGIGVGYVNSTSGNLTFMRRDIVVLNDGFFELSRIYDSKNESRQDFGPGWKLNLNQHIVVDEHTVYYYTPNGSIIEFILDGSNYIVKNKSKEHRFSKILLEEEYALLTLENKNEIYFYPSIEDKNLYLIKKEVRKKQSVIIEYVYSNDSMVQVKVNNRPILWFIRDMEYSNRISRAGDYLGREIYYEYDSRGRLAKSKDIAKNDWTYLYDENNLIVNAIDPEGRTYLDVAYYEDNKVKRIKVGSEYSFRYSNSKTEIITPSGMVHTFGFNSYGVTNSYHRGDILHWRIRFDGELRPIEVETLGNDRYLFVFNDNGNLDTRKKINSGTVIEYEKFWYDSINRLVRIDKKTSNQKINISYHSKETKIDGEKINILFKRDDRGRIISTKDDSVMYIYGYDELGMLNSISDLENSVSLTRDYYGKISTVQHSNGLSNRYYYDRLGNLSYNAIGTGVNYGSSYSHDSTGNMVRVEVRRGNNSISLKQYIDIGTNNRIEKIIYEGASELDILYNSDSLPVEISTSGNQDRVTIGYEQENHTRIIKRPSTGEEYTIRNQKNNMHISKSNDLKSFIFHGDNYSNFNLRYENLEIDWLTFELKLIDMLTEEVVGLREAYGLSSLNRLFLDTDYLVSEFNKPSNILLQPLEYMYVNCCVPCAWDTNCTDNCGDSINSFGNIELSVCYCQAPVIDTITISDPRTYCVLTESYIQDIAKLHLPTYAFKQPYEEGFSIFCSVFDLYKGRDKMSVVRGMKRNPCAVSVDLHDIFQRGILVGIAHTHPYFIDARDAWGCPGGPYDRYNIGSLNRDNDELSDTDKTVAESLDVPSYIRKSTRNKLRVYRKSASSSNINSWEEVDL